MNYLEINENKKLDNVYILTGDDYIITQTIKKIINLLNVNSINISKFNDENFDMLFVVNACNQFSFFNEKRIIVVEDINNEINASDKNLLNKYVTSPNNDCYLLIVDNHSVFSFLKETECIECKPNDNYLRDFIKQEFGKYGKNVDLSAILKLTENCRGNLNRIAIEIKKICDYLKDETNVNGGVIDEQVAKDIELKVFDLTTSLSQKNIQKAHKILYDMLKSGEPPIKILGLITSYFRRMFYAKISKDSDLNLAKELGCKEYAIKKARLDSARFTAKELKNIQNLLLEIDFNIKNGVMTQENALYYLIFKIVF